MTDWNTEAQRAVAHVETELSEAHRGAFLWYEPQKVVLVFSNGLEESPIPEKQLEFLKQAIEFQGEQFMLLLIPRMNRLGPCL